jgi:putative peptidoglycan lipid II flippase
MSQMLKSSAAVGAATLASRVLGLVREIVYAQFMGNGLVASAFGYAFAVPNLFRRLLGEGALTAAFIPHFKELQKQHGEVRMWRAANAVVSGLIVGGTTLVLFLVLVASALIWSRGFSSKTMLMLDLLRCMAPYLLLVCLAAQFMGMLNARGHFFVPALGAALLNVVMIAAAVWLAPAMGGKLDRQIFGLAIGVVLAGIAQCVYQIPLLRREGFHYHWVNPLKDPSVRIVARQMLPGVLGVAVFQINVLVAGGLGYWVGDHVVSSFNYAVRLMELPQGLFGMSLATYLLPTLSDLATDKKYKEFRAALQEGLGYVLFTNTVAAALLLVLAEPIIRLLFERGHFDALATEQVTRALWFLAPGLLAFSAVNIIARAFYALGDTQTPTKVSIACLILNLALTALFIRNLQQAGMALANTLTSVINLSLLLFTLRKKLGRLEFSRLTASLAPLLATGGVTGLIGWVLTGAWETHVGHAGFLARLGAVFAPAAVAGAVYLGLTWFLRIGYGHEAIDMLVVRVTGRVLRGKARAARNGRHP